MAGCTGSIARSGGPPEEDPSVEAGAPGGGSGQSSAAPGPGTGLRRLTRTEYNNTLHDLLGDTTRAGNVLNPDLPVSSGLDNNAAQLNLAVVDLEKYYDVTVDVVESALRPGSGSRNKLLAGCDPVAAGCARGIVAAFVRRAWRRLVEAPELDELMAALQTSAAQQDGVEEGVKLAMRMALLSPNFLYRIEASDGPAQRPVSPHELATRLSYFVWSTMPDDKLSAPADSGDLARPEIFAGEVARLVADSRASALVDNFAAQWLGTRAIGSVMPDPKMFPVYVFDDAVRKAMAAEPTLFFAEFLKNDRNVLEMLDPGFVYANDRLAKHYRLTPVTGTQMRLVPVKPEDHRVGLLTQAGFLTTSSAPDKTRPVLRGKWVLSRLLCSPPPPPPANVPKLPSDPKTVGLPANATPRQLLLDFHRRPECAACHAGMDAIGLALEHYDAIGRWRASYTGSAIDASGTLDSRPFDGAEQLSRLIADGPGFARCFAGTVFAYALGRDARSEGDRAFVEALATDFVGRGGKIRDLVGLIGASKAFQLNGGTQP